MRAISYDRPGEFSLAEIHDRPLAHQEVRIKNLLVGLCGTDWHLHNGENSPEYPLTPGHEIVAEVIEVGLGVDTLAPGDRVVVDNVVYCMNCERCTRGDFNFCLSRRSMGTKLPGGFAEHAVAHAHKCYPIGDLPLDQAVLTEPTACIIHGVEQLSLSIGADVLVVGAGPAGQVLAQVLRHAGASRIVMAGPTESKLRIARDLGADETVTVERSNPRSSSNKLSRLAPLGFDVVVDATGVAAVIESVVPHVKSGGTLMVYGMAGVEQRIALSPFEIYRRQLTIMGSFAQTHDFPRAVGLIRSGRVRSEGLITHRFSLDEYDKALVAVRSSDCIKAVIEPNGPV